MARTKRSIDLEALERAAVLYRQRLSPDEQVRFDARLEVDWRFTVMGAAYSEQIRDLALRRWESPPCTSHLDATENEAALLQALLDAGL